MTSIWEFLEACSSLEQDYTFFSLDVVVTVGFGQNFQALDGRTSSMCLQHLSWHLLTWLERLQEHEKAEDWHLCNARLLDGRLEYETLLLESCLRDSGYLLSRPKFASSVKLSGLSLYRVILSRAFRPASRLCRVYSAWQSRYHLMQIGLKGRVGQLFGQLWRDLMGSSSEAMHQPIECCL